MTYPPLDITAHWARTNEQLVSLVDVVPPDQWNWSPKEGLWNFTGIYLHVSMARYNWMINQVKDGGAPYDLGEFLQKGQTPDGIKQHLRESWKRLLSFLSSPGKLDATYEIMYFDKPQVVTGHWIAYCLLMHDIHHRADIFAYIGLLGVDHGLVETP